MTGTDSLIAHPINPGYIREHLLSTAIPSSGWWTTLLAQNNGGGNGIYTNPLRAAFYNEGLEITNPLDGFVQYWNPEGYQTIAQFPSPRFNDKTLFEIVKFVLLGVFSK